MADGAESRAASGRLASWFAIWHPRYRGLLIALVAAGAVTSGLVYVQDFMRMTLLRKGLLRDVPKT